MDRSSLKVLGAQRVHRMRFTHGDRSGHLATLHGKRMSVDVAFRPGNGALDWRAGARSVEEVRKPLELVEPCVLEDRWSGDLFSLHSGWSRS